MANKKNKSKKVIRSCSLEEELDLQIRAMSAETGASGTELIRRAVKSYMDDGQEDAMLMFYIVNLVEAVNEMKNDIPQEHYTKLQHCTENIIKIKGGKDDGRI